MLHTEKFENIESEINWDANLERYKEKILSSMEVHADSDFVAEVFNRMEKDIEDLFGLYSKQGYSIDQVEDDLMRRLEQSVSEGDLPQEQVYRNIWNLIQSREVKVFDKS